MVYKLNEKKEVRIPDTDIDRLMKTMKIDKDEAIEIWLEDEGYLINEEQEELVQKAKENKSHKIIDAKAINKPKKKTQKERVAKPNPDKEFLIQTLFNALGETNGCGDGVIVNKGKLIEFTYNGKQFKLDLIERRKKKDEKEV